MEGVGNIIVDKDVNLEAEHTLSEEPKEVSVSVSTSGITVLSNDLESNAAEALNNLVVDVEDGKDGDVVMTEL